MDAEQFRNLVSCLNGWRIAQNIIVSSASLFGFDYFLTFNNEIRLMWWKSISFMSIFFFVARYGGLVTVVISCLPVGPGARVWAIWERDGKLLFFMTALFIGLLIPIIIIIIKDVSTDVWSATVAPKFASQIVCQIVVSTVSQGWIMPYAAIVAYESSGLLVRSLHLAYLIGHQVILSLTTWRIARWRSDIPAGSRLPLINVLWRDGIIYFVFMLICGIINIALVIQLSTPQLRAGGTQLQTVFHSLLSTRTVLHVADMASRCGGIQRTHHGSQIVFTTNLQDNDYTIPVTQREDLHNAIVNVDGGNEVELGIVETN